MYYHLDPCTVFLGLFFFTLIFGTGLHIKDMSQAQKLPISDLPNSGLGFIRAGLRLYTVNLGMHWLLFFGFWTSCFQRYSHFGASLYDGCFVSEVFVSYMVNC